MAGLQNPLPQKQTNKKMSLAQLWSEHDNTMNKRRRQPSTGKKMMNRLADSKIFLNIFVHA